MDFQPTNNSRSPFIISEPVSGTNFFDREEIFEQIKDFIFDNHKQIYLIHGQRRIGKTSFLYKLFEAAHNEWNAAPVFFNLQGHAHDQLDDLLLELATSINNSLSQQKEEIATFEKSSDFYELFIPKIIKNLNNRKLIILFDEFDTIGAAEFIVEASHQNMAYNKFIPFLEKALDYFQRHKIVIKFIIACGRNYKDLEENRYGQLLKFAQQSELHLFSEGETRKLISIADNIIKFENETAKVIFDITGGHPMFTQCICDAAFRYAEKNNQDKVFSSTVNKITNTVIKQNASAVLWIWHTLPDYAKIVLYISAHLIENKNRVSTDNIKYQANIWNLTPATDNLDDTLDLLVRNRFLKYSNRKKTYIFYVEFIRKWIITEIYKEGITKLIGHFDEELKLYETNANFYFKSQNWNEAIKFAAKVLTRLPENYTALTQLMIANAKIGKMNTAFDLYNKAKTINTLTTEEILLNYNISFDEISENSKKRAIPQLIPCICNVCKNSNEPHYYNYSDLLLRKSKGKKTIECYKSFEDVNVDDLLNSVKIE